MGWWVNDDRPCYRGMGGECRRVVSALRLEEAPYAMDGNHSSSCDTWLEMDTERMSSSLIDWPRGPVVGWRVGVRSSGTEIRLKSCLGIAKLPCPRFPLAFYATRDRGILMRL